MRCNNAPIVKRTPSENRIASLLGLSREEYAHLNCSGIRPLTDYKGHILQYYIHISPFNPGNLLAKLRMNNRHMIYFSPDAFESIR